MKLPRLFAWQVLPALLSVAGVAAQQYTYSPFGTQGDGAAVVAGQLLGNLRPDLMLLSLDDGTSANPQNYVRYRILRDLDSVGAPAFQIPTPTTNYQMPLTLGNDAEGLGAAVTEINGNLLPDLLVLAYDAGTSASPANTFRWFVAKDLGQNGQFASFTAPQSPPPPYRSLGNSADGAGCAIGQIDANPLPDVVMMAYDDASGANEFRYVVGFNLNSNGVIGSWAGPYFVSGVGNEGDGADVCLAQLDSDPRPDLLLTAYDDPAGPNSFRSRLGFNLSASGQAFSWTSLPEVILPLNGSEVAGHPEGAGMAVLELGVDDRPDFVFVAQDTGGSASAPDVVHAHWRRNWVGISRSFGAGCAVGTLQTPYLHVLAGDLPKAGQSFTMRLDNSIGWTAATLLIDIGPAMQPFDLGALGLPSCTLYASQILTGMTGMPLFPQKTIGLPASAAGLELHAQAYAVGGAAGLGISQRCDIIVGP